MANYKRHEPTWPFLVILVILFVLSAASPRAWRIVERPDPPRPKPDHQLALRSPADRADQGTSRSSDIEKQSRSPSLGGNQAQKGTDAQDSTAPAVSSPGRESFSELAVQKAVGDDATHNQLPEEQQEYCVDGVAPELGSELVSDSNQPMTLGSEDDGGNSVEAPELLTNNGEHQNQEPIDENHRWTPPESLMALLQGLIENQVLNPWVVHVSDQVEKLGASFEEESPQVSAILDELQRCVDRSADLQMNLDETSQAANDFRQARYALIRRLALWKAIHLAGGLDAELAVTRDADWQRLLQRIAALNSRLGAGATAQSWREFLSVDAVAEIAQAAGKGMSNGSDEESDLVEVAQRCLARINRQALTAEQHALLREPVFEQYLNELRFWKSQSVTGAELLRDVETFETTTLTSDGEKVLDHYYRLSQSSEQRSQWVGECLNYLYRNANIRIVMTAAMLNRLVPQRPEEYRPVSETILNRPVYGSSLAQTNVGVRLIPDRERARLALVIRGEVSSVTYSQAGPATVWNDGFGRYVAEKAIEITPQGVKAEPAVIDVENSVRLRNVSTSLDSIPVLGFLAQEVARDQVARRRLEANEEARWKLAASVLREIETETESRFEDLNRRLFQEVLGPLYGLDLSPAWIGAETTEDRIVLRIRLGSAMQPGGQTLRPFALSNSLASCQIHESTVNNFLVQLNLEGQTFTIAELQTKLREKLRLPELDQAEENPHADAKITFADRDAVRVEFRNGRLAVLLSVAQLVSLPNRWEDFQVRAVYKPDVSHDRIEFVRDGVIQLVGPRDMRSQIALRGVFSKTFSKDRPWQVSPGFLQKNPNLSDLTITELTLEHGWLGFSVGTRSAAIDQTADQGRALSREPYGS